MATQNFDHPEIQKLKPFILNSQELLASNPVFAYYFKSYATKKLYEIFQKEKQEGKNVNELQTVLNIWLNELDQLKAQANIVNNKSQNFEDMKQYAINLFITADNEERNGQANKQTMQNFQLASRFFEALAFFGDIPQDLEEKKKYSKVKCVQIMKMLKDPALYQQYQEKILNEQNALFKIEPDKNQQQQYLSTQNQIQANQPMAGSVFQVKQKASTSFDNDSIDRIITYVSQSKINVNQAAQYSNNSYSDPKQIIHQSIQEKSQVIQQPQSNQKLNESKQQSLLQPSIQQPQYSKHPQQSYFTQPQYKQSQFQQEPQQQFAQQPQFQPPQQPLFQQQFQPQPQLPLSQQSLFQQQHQSQLPQQLPKQQIPQQSLIPPQNIYQQGLNNNQQIFQQYPKESNVQEKKMDKQKEEELIKLCEYAVSELDFKKHDEAKNNLIQALKILENY